MAAGAAALLLAAPLAALAQELTATTAAVPEDQLTLLKLIRQGGLTMIPLFLFSLATVALIIRNYMVLNEQKLLRPDLAAQVRHHLSVRHLEDARALCESEPCLLTEVVGAGLARARDTDLHIDRMREAIEEAGTEQLLSHMKPISYLSTIGTVSPMLGLLGTVSGMIKAFRHISAGGMGRPEILAGDIGEALVTTATGLIVAIPAMLFYYYFKGNFMKTMASLGRSVGTMLDALETGYAAEPHTHATESE
jgi:biopolymer transport protein ExbB